ALPPLPRLELPIAACFGTLRAAVLEHASRARLRGIGGHPPHRRARADLATRLPDIPHDGTAVGARALAGSCHHSRDGAVQARPPHHRTPSLTKLVQDKESPHASTPCGLLPVEPGARAVARHRARLFARALGPRPRPPHGLEAPGIA